MSMEYSPITGFGVAIGLLLWAVIFFLSPRYLRLSGKPLASLGLYALGTLFLVVAVVGFGLEMSEPRIGDYFGELLSEGPTNMPWAGPSSAVWANGGIAAAFLVAAGFFHVAANILLNRRVLEILLKLCGLFFGALAAMFFAGFVDELITKPLLVIPATRLASGQTADTVGGFGTFLVGLFKALFALATIISTLAGAVVALTYVYKRVVGLLRQHNQSPPPS